jgi:hypothetical protein
MSFAPVSANLASGRRFDDFGFRNQNTALSNTAMANLAPQQDSLAGLIDLLKSTPNGLQQGQLLRELDTLTGDRAVTDALGSKNMPRLQLADASTFNWGQLGVRQATAQGLGFPNAQRTAPPVPEPPGTTKPALKGLGWIGGGLLLNEALQKFVGPAPVLKSETAIGSKADLAITIYGKSYTGTEAAPGSAFFTRGIGGAKLDVPVQMSEKGFRFDPKLLERALGNPLPPELQGQTQSQPRTKTTLDDNASPKSIPSPIPKSAEKEPQPKRCENIGIWGPEPGYAARADRQPNANAYQDFINKRPGENFYVPRVIGKPIAFDGCVNSTKGAILLEAKGKYPYFFGGVFFKGNDAIIAQGNTQQKIGQALGVQVEWKIQTARDTQEIKNLFEAAEPNPITLSVEHKPMPTGPR